MIGTKLSHFRILAKLGEGGMGVVYRAEDEKLRRPVALKVLPPELVANEERRLRFLREARTAAAVSHPNIAAIHEVDEVGGVVFIAMELVEGKTLRELIGGRPLPIKEAVRIAAEMAEGLAHAHQARVIHRDFKPDNVMVRPDQHVKILDFGLAKLLEEHAGAGVSELSKWETISGGVTRAGKVLGTPAYMSPEQARGETVDRRTDIWSLGVMLYEMVSGQAPFQGEHPASVIHAILKEDPRSIRKLRREVSSQLERIILRCLEKNRDARYPSAEEIRKDLTELQVILLAPTTGVLSPGLILRSILRPRIAIPATLLLLALLATGAWGLWRAARVRWAREQALPEIIRLIEEERFVAAFALARRAERVLPSDPLLANHWPRMSHEVSIETTPPGAKVYMKEYATPAAEWEYVGESPMKRRIPWGIFRWRVQKEGFIPLNGAASRWDERIRFRLDEEGSTPGDMVRVLGESFSLEIPGLEDVEPVVLEDFLIDRSEVTNRQFKAFVDAGGYLRQEYWAEEIVKDGRRLSWDRAMAQFRDSTGRPGPATWSEGDYPKGQDDYPVAGVSWYEAAAYAKFASKELPTIFHWSRAAGAYLTPAIVPLSNFGSSGPARACSHQGIGPYGTCDVAGNVKEWVWNETAGQKRYILGGGWGEPTYMFNDYDAQAPIARSANYGFRCMRRLSTAGVPARAAAPLQPPFRNYVSERPVRDEVFQIYKNLYSYDRTPADPVIESADDGAEGWRKEKIVFKAPYGSERITAYLYLPKRGSPPYQTILYFPGSNVIYERSSENLDEYFVDFLLRSGRAVIWPIYKGTFERRDDLKSDYPNTTSSYRDHVIKWSQEVGASIDYLETRDDIDHKKLGFYGLSWGAAMGSILPALEGRLKVNLLLGGGFYLQRTLPEVDQINFAPRVKIPTLMLNGRYDFFFPLESSQKPMFRLLGSPEKDKTYMVYEAGHIIPRPEMIKEMLNWLDRYLGPVD